MKKRVVWFAAGALLLSATLCGCRSIPQDRAGAGETTVDAGAGREPSAEPVTEAVGALVSRILRDASPAAEVSTEVLAPGERTPVAQLKQAPQELVGAQLELEISDLAGGTVVYRFTAESRRLVALCQAGDGEARGYVMLVLQTEDSMEAFLSRDRAWTGKVEAVKIIDGNDMALSGNAVAGLGQDGAVRAGATSAVCYGILGDTRFAGPWNASADDAAAFLRTLERFEIKP
ncbi:MAG TPA: hypothetical protein DDW30_06195 [Clostridiales bacterium]|nr:hypothetical protein [Clostridiales bacterium]